MANSAISPVLQCMRQSLIPRQDPSLRTRANGDIRPAPSVRAVQLPHLSTSNGLDRQLAENEGDGGTSAKTTIFCQEARPDVFRLAPSPRRRVDGAGWVARSVNAMSFSRPSNGLALSDSKVLRRRMSGGEGGCGTFPKPPAFVKSQDLTCSALPPHQSFEIG